MLPSFSPEYLTDCADTVSYQRLVWPALDKKKLAVYLRRDDLVSSRYPGNKFYKLFYNLKEILSHKPGAVVSFGGAYSNHIHALAAMGQEYHIPTVGIIRGHQPTILSPTLQDAKEWGMRLLFLNRQSYQQKDLSCFQAVLEKDYGDYYLLPEGGENMAGVEGCSAIGKAIGKVFSGCYSVCCAVGTGTTMAGVVSGLPEQVHCLGFSVLKGDDRLSCNIEKYLSQLQCQHKHWRIMTGFHHGGYAKLTQPLLRFMQSLEVDNDLLLEPVYSAKMLWGIERLAIQDYWPQGSEIIAIHGGGLQGRRGFSQLQDVI